LEKGVRREIGKKEKADKQEKEDWCLAKLVYFNKSYLLYTKFF